MTNDLSARLRATFLAELDDQVRALEASLLALEKDATDREAMRALFRGAHSIKGAARVAGFPLIEEVCHALESVFARARDGELELGAPRIQLLFHVLDALAGARNRLREGAPLDEATLRDVAHRLDDEPTDAFRDFPATTDPITPPAGSAPEPEPEPTRADAFGETIRVHADRLDDLAVSAGELLITSGTVERRHHDWLEFRDGLVRWARRYARLTRTGATVGQRNADLNAELQRLVQQADRVARSGTAQQAALQRITGEVVGGVRGLRLRRFADVTEGLPRAVRDIAARTGKQLSLEIEGDDIEADRVVIDALRDPLLQLVRNAADHGIEQPKQRSAAGKPTEGTIRILATHAAGRLRIDVADDGAGIDTAAVRARMLEITGRAPADDHQLARALLDGGISTRRTATELSGRGVGLDVVRAALARIGGDVRLSWRAGRGTRVTLEAPPTPAALRALIVGVGSQLFAIPVSHAQRIVRVRPEHVRRAEGRTVLMSGDAPAPLGTLAALLGPPFQAPPPAEQMAAVLIERAGERAAIVVDTLVDEAEIVIRPLPARTRVRHVTGGALLPDGRIALVLGVGSLFDAALRYSGETPIVDAAHASSRQRVMIADDSITTRTLEQSVLEAAGYEVIVAVDGQDAWEKIRERGVDVLIADVEMPRMDGIELCRRVRASRHLAELPIVLVTGLESEQDRARGLEAGADAYITKSSFDQTALLDVVRRLVS